MYRNKRIGYNIVWEIYGKWANFIFIKHQEPKCFVADVALYFYKRPAKALFGWASFLSVIVYEKFRNIDTIKKA